MVDWERNSPQLQRNLVEVARRARESARDGEVPTLEMARRWHREMMQDLDVPNEAWVGRFRGENGVEGVEIAVAGQRAVESSQVTKELEDLFDRFGGAVALLDERVTADEAPTARQLRWILRTGAWLHAEWVRIHPFVNGNGRTARLWVNWLLMRYGLPPVIRLRPRPKREDYARAAGAAMDGEWRPMLEVLEKMLP